MIKELTRESKLAKFKYSHCALVSLLVSGSIYAESHQLTVKQEHIIKRLLSDEFLHSTLSESQQKEELKWFMDAAKPFQGMTIRVVSENIATHRYESNVLAKAFTELTGIHVVHEITEEDDLVKKLQVQLDTGISLYDAYVNDADFLGTHYRSQKVVAISEMINDKWRDITLPTLALDDFIGIDFVTGPDDILYQLPTQQFANLYWYRHDWFSRPDLQKQFKQLYGYALGVPQNWAAYQDIAEFFTEKVQYIDDRRVWGHMDYGHFDPSLGWRISDSWLSLAGANQTDSSVGDWGIRLNDCHPAGASVSRGGALDSPAAIYAVNKYVQWLTQYAPPEAIEQDFISSSEYLAKGNIAQQIFWYTAFLPDLSAADSSVMNEKGEPVWRVAPSPRGKYWKEGMKSGYQDIGGWTFLWLTPDKRSAAAWLYAQFTVSKTVSMQKFLNGFTPIRQSDIQSSYLQARSKEWGGLLEFYQSDARNYWTPTGFSVPDYAELASVWWQHIGPAVKGDVTVEDSMRMLADEMDSRLKKIGNRADMRCEPRLNDKSDAEVWLNKEGAPWKEIINESTPKTLSFEESYQQWKK